MTKTVLVFGGGVTGLTVAHECREAGAEVILCERDARFGGKALSYRLGSDDVVPGAPVEHSLRTFHSSYFSLFETMRRIPRGAGTVFDTLTPVPALTLVDGSDVREMMRIDTDLSQPLLRRARAFWRVMRAFGLPWIERLLLITMIAAHVLSTNSRRRRQGSRRVDEFFRLERRSRAFSTFLLSLVDIIFGAKRDASAMVVIDMLARLALARLASVDSLRFMTNTLVGPINECFIDPWVAHLRAIGVDMRENAAVAAFEWDEGAEAAAPRAARLWNGERVAADAIVLAVSPAALADLLPAVYAKSPLPKMRRSWSFGMQFFCSRPPEGLAPRDSFALVIGSPWAIIYLIEAPPQQPRLDLPEGVAAVLSVTVSAFDTPGSLFGKSFWSCSFEEVEAEVLAQIGLVNCDMIIGAHLDPHLRRMREDDYFAQRDGALRGWEVGPASDGFVWALSSPLWIFGPESGADGMGPRTNVPGVFVAGEFSATSTKQPTMEKANQAGKLCAAAVLSGLDLPYDRSRLERPLRGWLARQLYP